MESYRYSFVFRTIQAVAKFRTSTRKPISIYSCNVNDYDAIQNLFLLKRMKYFGNPKCRVRDAGNFFSSYASHRLLAEANTDLIGFAEFSIYPKIDALPKICWMDWLNVHYCIDLPIRFGNTFFLDILIYARYKHYNILEEMLSELFLREMNVDYVLVVQMPEYNTFGRSISLPKFELPDWSILDKYSKVYYPRCFSVNSCSNTQRIHVITREKILTPLRFRKALPEDNDDLVEIIQIERPDLRTKFGDFYIAEHLLKEDQGADTLIVAEENNVTVGICWVNSDVNVMAIIENYEVHTFGNLINFDPNKNSRLLPLQVTDLERPGADKLFNTQLWKIPCEAHGENQLFASTISTYTLSSQYIMKIKSESGTVSTTNEHYGVMEYYFHKVGKLHETLHSIEHYVLLYLKNINVHYNVPDNYDSETDEEYSLDAHPNVFALQLFGISKTNDIRRIQRFLLAAFNYFPERDYCLFSFPIVTRLTPSIREILKYFIRVDPRPHGIVNDYLYIVHRSSLFGEISIHPVDKGDEDDIRRLMLHGLESYKESKDVRDSSILHIPPMKFDQEELDYGTVIEIMRNVLKNPSTTEYKFMTIRCGNSAKPIEFNPIIGFVILKKFLKRYQLKTHFHVPHSPQILDLVRAQIVILKLHPFHLVQSTPIFRELARNTEFWEFYYFEPTRSHVKALPNDLCKYMQPVEPKRIKAHVPSQKVNTSKKAVFDMGPIEDLELTHEFYAAYVQNLRPEKLFGNKRSLIIIGFSNVCKAFLRLLIFGWNSLDSKNANTYCCLPNINVKVITPPGVVEAEYDTSFQCTTCHDANLCWMNCDNSSEAVRDCTLRIDFRKWVQFLSGKITRIDRTTKQVILNEKCYLHYDLLLLLSETTFGFPKSDDPPSTPTEASRPPNYVHINNRLDKIFVYHSIQIMKTELGDDGIGIILVYGSNIYCYEFINFLLTHGVRSDRIVLVKPYYPMEQKIKFVENINFTDESIEYILERMLDDLKVAVYDKYNFAKWYMYKKDHDIKAVRFVKYPYGEDLVLKCDFFVSFFPCDLSYTLVDTLVQCGLKVQNRKIIVRDNYQTADPTIFAFGNYIQHMEKPNHQYSHVNPIEAAEKLIYLLNLHIHNVESLEKKFSRPAYFQAQLPMGHYMAKITLPKRYLANHLTNDYTCGMTTYENKTFCRIRLNDHRIIEEIVIVAAKFHSFDFLQFFVGKHEALLNDLKNRWLAGEIKNFFTFLQEPWTEIIMHENYNELRRQNLSVFLETAIDLMNDKLTRAERQEILRERAEDAGIIKEMEKNILNFIRQYRRDFNDLLALPENFHLRF